MFSGIIQDIGEIESINATGEAMELKIKAKEIITAKAALGDSVSVNGVCLTITKLGDDCFTVDVMPETYRATNLAMLNMGSAVNLESSLAIGDKLGGHFVSGHVDAVGTIIQVIPDNNAVNYIIEIDKELIKYCVYRGSIAIDGISLTIFGIEGNNIKLALIPHTVKHTILGQKKPGDKVNIECDLFSKHIVQTVENILGHNNKNEYDIYGVV